MNTVARVLSVNGEILGVTAFLVLFMLLFTSALIWAVSTPEIAKINEIDDVFSAMCAAQPSGSSTFEESTGRWFAEYLISRLP